MSPMKRCERQGDAPRPGPILLSCDAGRAPRKQEREGGLACSHYRRLCLGTTLMAALLLQACAAPAANTAPPATTAATAQPARIQVDTRCGRDSDCAVKNVGNCCGAYPACVNNDSPTDPAGVMARCQASGRMSVCGFRQIRACECRAGQCTEATAPPVSTSPTLEPSI